MQPTAPTRRTERGLATLDVLLGLAIFALVAVIAISAINQYRARAFENGTISDARTLGHVIEAEVIGEGSEYPPDLETARDLINGKVALTPGNGLASYVLAPDGNFHLCVEHDTGAYARYYSSVGAVTVSEREGSCPPV